MDLELSGKTALVTGGSRGIGKAIARQLAAEGVRVAIAARNQETLESTAAELSRENGSRVVAITCDTGSDASVRAMVERAMNELGWKPAYPLPEIIRDTWDYVRANRND